MVLLSESGKEENPVVRLDDKNVKESARLNRNYFRLARKALVDAKLIRATRVGMSTHRYEILNADGRPLSDKRKEDDYGIVPEFQFAPKAC
jgi:hypothetical protein